MNGLTLESPSRLKIVENDQETLNENDVRLKIIYGGICGSDLSVYNGKLPHADYPVRPGHEILGIIEETGTTSPYSAGERAIVQPNTYCGECEYCLQGKTNICPYKKSLGINADGGFAEEVVIDSKYVMSVDPSITDKRAILIEPLAVIVHALKKVKVNEKKKVAVIGCGTEGMLALALADYLGGNVSAVDINEDKLRKVKSNYESVKVNYPEEVKNSYFDIVIEAAGTKSSFEQSIDIVKPGGEIVCVGMTPEAQLSVTTLVRKEITLYGSIIYNVPDDFTQTMEYLKASALNVEPVISKIFPFHDYQHAYDEALSGKQGKIILQFGEEK